MLGVPMRSLHPGRWLLFALLLLASIAAATLFSHNLQELMRMSREGDRVLSVENPAYESFASDGGR